jgi:hypothetical protein
VHHGLSIPSSVNEKRRMHQGYVKVVTNIVQSYQISFSNITDSIGPGS